MRFLVRFESLLRHLVFGEKGFSEKSSAYSEREFGRLIARAEARFINKTGLKGFPLCWHCGGKMMFRHSNLAGGSGSPLREDQGWKCPTCFSFAGFGIPLTQKEYAEELKLRKGVYLSRPTFRRDERNRRDVKERLRALGYLAFERRKRGLD